MGRGLDPVWVTWAATGQHQQAQGSGAKGGVRRRCSCRPLLPCLRCGITHPVPPHVMSAALSYCTCPLPLWKHCSAFQASETTYRQSVCKLDGSVSRFNADTHGPDCNRSEGKVLILATMHDTFPMPLQTRLYWVSCKDFETAQRLKAEVYLKNPKNLPSCVEYMNR